MYVLTNTRVNELHRRMVFRFIWKRKTTSRPEIGRVLGFSKSTVSGIIQSLEEEGLITVSGFAGTSLGRRPEILAVNPEGPRVVSVLLKDTGEVETALLGLCGEIVARRRDFLPRKDPEGAVESVLESVRGLLPAGPLLGVGIGLPGIVDHERGRIEYAAHFGWREVPFGEMIRRVLPYPVFVENRTVAATLGEMWFGKGLGRRNFLCLYCGDALGAGMVIEGKIYRSSLLGAGEIGHIPVAQARKMRCSCGRWGCAETVVSFPSIMKKLGEEYRSEEAAFSVLRDHQDTTRVRHCLEEAFAVVGEVTAMVLNILAPETVIFTGALPRVNPSFFLDFVRQTVAEKALLPISQKVSLELGSLPEGEEVLWGQAVVMERLFAVNYPLGG